MEEQYFGVESRRSPSGGSRLAQPPKKPKKHPKKQRRNPLLTIGKIFYILLTVVSASRTGAKMASGVMRPVRPTCTVMSSTTVSFCSGGYL